MDRDGSPGPERRGFIDLPRWMDGELALGASGLFAVAGVLAIIGAIVVVTIGVAGRLAAATTAWVSLLLLATGVLALVMHRRAERRAVSAGKYLGLPPERTVAVGFPSTGNWVRALLEGRGTGFLVVEEDHLGLRSRWDQPGLFGFYWLAFQLTQHMPWYVQVLPLPLAIYSIASPLRWRKERYPWAEVPSVVVRGNRLALEFAVAEDRRDLVVSFGAKDRARLIALLGAHCRIEEIPEPVRPAKPPAPAKPQAPRPARPAPPPRTAIDGKTEGTLDDALRKVRDLEGGRGPG